MSRCWTRKPKSSTTPPCAISGDPVARGKRQHVLREATTRSGRKVAFSNFRLRLACPDPARQRRPPLLVLYLLFRSSLSHLFPIFTSSTMRAVRGEVCVGYATVLSSVFSPGVWHTNWKADHDVLVPAAWLLSFASSSCMSVSILPLIDSCMTHCACRWGK